MRAMFYDTFGKTPVISDLTDPTPSDAGVIIAVEAAGICRSDWHGWMGHDPDIRLPHVPGHELAGTIAATGRNVMRYKVGDRVTVPFVSGCGRCDECRSGNQQVCPDQFQPASPIGARSPNMSPSTLPTRTSFFCPTPSMSPPPPA